MRYLITFSYDGSKYNGYQKQVNKNTVQDKIEEALFKITKEKISIHASGRTDAKVHALNQKAHFGLEKRIKDLKNALNHHLPKDIHVKSLEEVDSNFHARFNVKTKEYIYKINIGEYNPLEKDYVYQYNKKLNIKKMKKALKDLKGTHNFKTFSKTDETKNNYVRTITKVSMTLKKDILTISFKGTGFLRYMVRNMVGTLIEIGEGKGYKIKELLFLEDRTKAGKTAHPEGLYLKDVNY